MNPPKTFGKWLRLQRQHEGMTQQQLAELVGVDRTYINKIERGKVGMPQFELRQRLGEYLGFNDDDVRDAGFLEDSIPTKDTVLIRVERTAADAITSLAEEWVGGRIRFDHESLQFLASIARVAKTWSTAQKIDALRRMVEEQTAEIDDYPSAIDPNDPRVELATRLGDLPDDAIDSLLTMAIWWERQIKERVVAGEEDAMPTAFYPSPTGGGHQW